MIAVTYRLCLDEPLLATVLEGDPNSSVSADFIPGSSLRGMLIGRYLRQQGQQTLDPTDPTARRLFFDGTTRFLNGYPLDSVGHRSLPVPRSWVRAKDHDASTDPLYDLVWDPGPVDQPQAVSAPFHTVDTGGDNDPVCLLKPNRQLTIHTARDRQHGRPVRGSGAVFRYDALAPGQRFGAAIGCASRDDAERLRDLLAADLPLTLGGSRTAGYGRTTIEAGSVAVTDDWDETDRGGEIPPDDRLVVTLLSDLLIRDDWGQPAASAAALTGALEARLGCSLTLRKAFLGDRLVGGFNRTWGLPLPQAPALTMGSVLVYNRPPPAAAARLPSLVETGVGERQAEGFGRLAVNWYQWKHRKAAKDEGRRVWTPAPLRPDSPSRPLARRMVERIARQGLGRALEQRAEELTRAVPSSALPSPAQLGRLRALLGDCLGAPPEQVRSRLDAYASDTLSRSVARRQWERAVVNGVPLVRWASDLVANPSAEWRALLRAAGPEGPPRLGGIAAGDLGGDGGPLATEYALRLAIAVVDRLAKAATAARGGLRGE